MNHTESGVGNPTRSNLTRIQAIALRGFLSFANGASGHASDHRPAVNELASNHFTSRPGATKTDVASAPEQSPTSPNS